tara:strand:+ start:154 stop:765 length:612 start_codon:yes stop_codon:yes gene_type:complete
MFTGIIEDIGEIYKIKTSGGKIFFISTKIHFKNLKVGSSISCNGVCLTITKRGKKKKRNWFVITASKETLKKSNLDLVKVGSLVNLETSLKLGDEISGHLVFGHIDESSQVLTKKYEGSSVVLKIETPFELKNFITSKGSISINGVSLTINDVFEDSFEINIIPHTLKTTIFDKVRINELLNIEVDMIARYVSRQINNNKFKK